LLKESFPSSHGYGLIALNQERLISIMNQTRLRLIRFSKGIGEIWNAPCPVNIPASCFSVLDRDSFHQRCLPPPVCASASNLAAGRIQESGTESSLGQASKSVPGIRVF
jgi:hypothetical protein